MSTDKDTKQQIIDAAMDLMSKEDIDAITMRKVAKHAGVTAGLINYHFQTKDNLINQVIRAKINAVIDRFPEVYQTLQGKPMEKLKQMLHSTSKYLLDNERISRISIISDYIDPSPVDNSMKTILSYYTVVNEVLGSQKSEIEKKLITLVLVGIGQLMFLRSDNIRGLLGLDFANDDERDQLFDLLINFLFDVK